MSSVIAGTVLTGLVVVAPAADADPTWLPARPASVPDQEAQAPQVAMDADGSAVAVWYRYDNDGHTRVQAATRVAGGSWSAPVDLSPEGQDAYQPHVAVDPEGSAVAVWFRGTGGDKLVQGATRPAGGGWSDPVDLSEPGPNPPAPDVVVDADGNATAVWYRYRESGHTRVEAATRPAGGDWTGAAAISEAAANAYDPRVAVDAAGNATVVWYRLDDGDDVVRAATRPSGGSWGPPETLSEPGQSAYEPQVAVDPAGNTTAIWRHGTRIQAATRPTDGSWTTPETLSDPAQQASQPQLAVDPAGNTTAVWCAADGSDVVVHSSVLDATGPVITDLRAPEDARAGRAVSLSVSAHDVWSGVASYAWDFGDGRTATGQQAGHTWTSPGARQVTVTVTDGIGNTTTRTTDVVVAAAAPRITRFALRPRRISRSGDHGLRRTRAVVRITTDASARIVIRGTHRVRKVRVGLRRELTAGTHRITLRTRIRGTRLRPGRYRVRLLAISPGGRSVARARLRVTR